MYARFKTVCTANFIAILTLLQSPCTAEQPVVIRLHPVIQVTHRLVQLSDIAELADKDRFRLEDADLIVIPDDDSHAIIDKSLIDVRLRLLGLSRTDYELIGPDQIILSVVDPGQKGNQDARFSLIAATRTMPSVENPVPSQPPSDLMVEQAIQAALGRQFELPPEEVKVQLLRPFVDDRLLETEFTNAARIEVMMPVSFPYGRTNQMIQFWDGNRLAVSRMSFIEVRRRQRLLVARKAIARSDTLTEDSVAQEVRFVDALRDELQFRDLRDLPARRTIRAGEILTLNDFEGQARNTSAEQVIHARDAVRIVGERKGVKFVVPAAEALQSGHLGQLIRVRNLHSNRIVVCRVIAAGEVEAPLE